MAEPTSKTPRSALKKDGEKPKVKKAVSIDRPVQTMGGNRDMNMAALMAGAKTQSGPSDNGSHHGSTGGNSFSMKKDRPSRARRSSSFVSHAPSDGGRSEDDGKDQSSMPNMQRRMSRRMSEETRSLHLSTSGDSGRRRASRDEEIARAAVKALEEEKQRNRANKKEEKVAAREEKRARRASDTGSNASGHSRHSGHSGHSGHNGRKVLDLDRTAFSDNGSRHTSDSGFNKTNKKSEGSKEGGSQSQKKSKNRSSSSGSHTSGRIHDYARAIMEETNVLVSR